jgi:predicted MPP superfamily phosphohydrolase
LFFGIIPQKAISNDLLLLFAALALWAFAEPYWLQDKIYVIASQDILPKFHNAEILPISDIHHGPFPGISMGEARHRE